MSATIPPSRQADASRPSVGDALGLLDRRAVSVQRFIAEARERGDLVEVAEWEGVAGEIRFLRLELTDPTPRADDTWNVVCTSEPTA